MSRERLLNAIAMPATTPPAIVWREFWLAGFDVPHPAPDQTLERWIESLPDQLSSRKPGRWSALQNLRLTAPTHTPLEHDRMPFETGNNRSTSANRDRLVAELEFKANVKAWVENNPAFRKLKENIDYLASCDPKSLRQSINAVNQARATLVANVVAAGVLTQATAESMSVNALKELAANVGIVSGPVIDRDSVGSFSANIEAAAESLMANAKAAGSGDNVVQMPDRVSLLNGSTDVGSFAANLKAGGGDK